jgi:acetylornithine deacetylase
MVKTEHIAEMLSRLVQIPSVTPRQAGARAGTPGEAAIASFVAKQCSALGAKVEVQNVLPGRPAVYSIWRARGSKRWIGIDVHLDTVGVETMEGDPFSGAIDEGRVHGRGAVDTKASLAVALAMLEAVKARTKSLPCNLILAATADEEDSATGAPAFAAWLRKKGTTIDELVVSEPTLCAPVIGHKGVVRIRMDIRGKAAHSSNPSRGRNAITAAGRVVDALNVESRRLARQKSPLGSPTLAVTMINGGSGINIVPEHCSISLDRRVVAGESAKSVSKKLLSLAKRSCPLAIAGETSTEIDAFHQDQRSPFVKRMSQWTRQRPAIAPYCTNAWAYRKVARECIVLGPGSIAQAHAAAEWVEISQLAKLASVYAQWWGV